jgi:hypothetical protein
MFKMTAEINASDIKNLLQSFSGDLVRKSIRSGLDRTGTWAKNYIANDLSTNFNLKSSRIKQAIIVKRTTQTALEVTVNVKSSPLSMLGDFGAIQDATGIQVQFSRTERLHYPHAFINKARSSGKAVIMKRVGPKRYPTTGKPGRGPTIPTLMDRSKGREQRDAAMQDHLYLEIEQQIAKRTMQEAPIAEIE